MSNLFTIPEYQRKDCVLPGQPFVDELSKSIGWQAWNHSGLSHDQRNALAWRGQRKLAAFGRAKFFGKSTSAQLRLLSQSSKEIIEECEAQRKVETLTFIGVCVVVFIIGSILKYFNVIGK